MICIIVDLNTSIQALRLGYMKLKFNEVDAYINIKNFINKDII